MKPSWASWDIRGRYRLFFHSVDEQSPNGIYSQRHDFDHNIFWFDKFTLHNMGSMQPPQKSPQPIDWIPRIPSSTFSQDMDGFTLDPTTPCLQLFQGSMISMFGWHRFQEFEFLVFSWSVSSAKRITSPHIRHISHWLREEDAHAASEKSSLALRIPIGQPEGWLRWILCYKWGWIVC